MSEVMPDPEIWPVCTTPRTGGVPCSTPFVLRLSYQFTDNGIKARWLWGRDCKHKGAKATHALHNSEGEVIEHE